MELELKHLAGYLPYGLKAEMLDYKNDYVNKKYDEIIGVHQWSKNKDWCLLTDGGSKPSLERIKPILRNLSDLTKEIEVNGEKFVPSIEYNHLRFEEISTIKAGDRAMGFIQVREQEILYQLHFDIHGLIENNLAIDMNTLNESK
jgi:hypothetical protein